ncbi:MAG: hypothetical protein ABEL97_13710 [Salinibacter sp.]
MRRLCMVALTSVLALVWTGCSGPASMTTVRRSGNSVNYQFESSKWVNKKTDECGRIEVRVRPKAKLYTNARKPPDRLTVVDTDCQTPFDIEQARYVDQGGVFLTGNALRRFRGQYPDLFQELYMYVNETVINDSAQ